MACAVFKAVAGRTTPLVGSIPMRLRHFFPTPQMGRAGFTLGATDDAGEMDVTG